MVEAGRPAGPRAGSLNGRRRTAPARTVGSPQCGSTPAGRGRRQTLSPAALPVTEQSGCTGAATGFRRRAVTAPASVETPFAAEAESRNRLQSGGQRETSKRPAAVAPATERGARSGALGAARSDDKHERHRARRAGALRRHSRGTVPAAPPPDREVPCLRYRVNPIAPGRQGSGLLARRPAKAFVVDSLEEARVVLKQRHRPIAAARAIPSPRRRSSRGQTTSTSFGRE
jgi:hypothetical protein